MSAEVIITTIYTISDYAGNAVTVPVTHTVTIKNPCIDPEFVEIAPITDFEDYDYIIDSGFDVFDAHASFIVVTNPV
jgi:hypothetical protein